MKEALEKIRDRRADLAEGRSVFVLTGDLDGVRAFLRKSGFMLAGDGSDGTWPVVRPIGSGPAAVVSDTGMVAAELAPGSVGVGDRDLVARLMVARGSEPAGV